MRVFAPREVAEAVAHSLKGGMSLHLHRIIPDRRTAPKCFVDAVDRGDFIAHLFCLDAARLRAAAHAFGVRIVHIDRAGTARQHIDLCSGPLRRAFNSLDADQKPKLAELLALLPKPVASE